MSKTITFILHLHNGPESIEAEVELIQINFEQLHNWIINVILSQF